MQLKRFFSILLAVALIISALTFTAGAETNETLKVGVEVMTATPVSSEPLIINQGQEVSVRISISQNPGISVLWFVTRFDTNALQFVSLSSNELISSSESIVQEIDNGRINYYINLGEGFSTAAGELFKINFTTKTTFCGETTVYSELRQGRPANCAKAISKDENIYIPFESEAAEFSIHNITTEGVATESACLDGGYTTYHCDACGQNVIGDTLSANGHSPMEEPVIENKVDPDCTTDGSYDSVIYCSVCNAELSRKNETIPALGHDYVPVVTSPTCTEQGYTTYTCSRCEDSFVDNYVIASGHEWDDWTIAIPPECTVEGLEKRVCKNDPSHTETRPVNALGHIPSEPAQENSSASTCTTQGYYDEVVYCSVCGAEISREKKYLSIIGHDIVHHDAKEATCTESGWDAYDTCTRCDYTTYVEIPALGHDIVHHDAKAPTCLDIGWDAYDTCTRCDYTSYNELDALGHNYSDEWEYDNYRHWRSCSVCSDKTDDGKHTYVDGKCSVCGYGERINFPDVNYKDWYGPAVDYAVNSGLMKGYANGKFGTYDGIQRQDFIVILARLSGDDMSAYKGQNSFNDVPTSAYYTTALAWAKDKKVSNGYKDGNFGVGDKVTREQIVTFLYNYAKLKGYDTTVTDEQKDAISAQHSDFNRISSYAQTAAYWALSRGVISGKNVGGQRLIDPRANAMRCEVAAIFYNISQKNVF